MSDTRNGLSRRTLAKGAAWAAPAVAFAASAPSFASSPVIPPCVTFDYTGDPCRRSNEGIYKFGFCITNTCTNDTITLCITELTNGAGKTLVPQGASLPPCKTLKPGDQLCMDETVWVGDSQAQDVYVYGTVNGGAVSLLFIKPAPQKKRSCAPGYVSPAQAKAASETTTAPVETKTTTEAPAKKVETKTTTEAKKVETTTTTAKVETKTTTEAPAATPAPSTEG